jgi:hypothetical protein
MNQEPTPEARRTADELDLLDDRPVLRDLNVAHGSWLNMAEIELSVLGRQCLKRRIPDTKALRREAKAWQKERNQLGRSVDWRFTTKDARTKLRSLYPPEKV